MFAEIAFPISNFKTFTYEIPDDLRSSIQVGSRVIAPFGKRKVQGIIVTVLKEKIYQGQIKQILGLIDDYPVVTPELWKLITWISNYYMAPIGQVSKAVFPKNLSTRYKPQKIWFVKIKKIVSQNFIANLKKKAPKQYEVLNKIIFESSPIRVSSLKKNCIKPITDL